MTETLILPGEQLRAEIEALGFKTPGEARDRDYACPSVEWLKEMGKWIFDHPWIYQSERADCDDAALDLVVESGRALVASRLDGAGHAVCFCTIIITEGATLNQIEGGGHATTIVRTPDGWMFFERESGTYEDATKAINDGRVTCGFCLI